jgi:hypothetical protein
MSKKFLSGILAFTGLVLLAADTVASPSAGLTIASGPAMTVNRMGHYTVNLPDGKVVLFGGHGTSFVSLKTAEIYDPSGSTFSPLTMNYFHDAPALSRINGGKYLLAGGAADLGVAPGYATAEIFLPGTNAFLSVSSMKYGRMTCGAATLGDASVLIVGGWYDNNSATYGEVFIPGPDTFALTGALNTPRSWPMVVPTNDGKAVIFGGYGVLGGNITQQTELYNPADKSFSILSNSLFGADSGWISGTLLSYDRTLDQQRLTDGTYLFFAGKDSAYQLFTFDPATKAFAKAGDALVDTTLSFTAPIVDTVHHRAYVIGEQWGTGANASDRIKVCCFIINTTTWAWQIPTARDTLADSYFLSGIGVSILPGGKILISGGNSQTGYQTNFSPITSTLIATPDTQMASGIKAARLAVTGNSGPYAIRSVRNGLRLSSAIRENLTVKLHAVSGKTIAVLFTGIVEPAISYDFSLTGRKLGSGVYYCTLESAKNTKTVKLVLTK